MSNIVIPTITVNGQTILHTESKYCGENIEVNVAIPNPTLDGTAITDYVLAPYTFYKDNLTKLIGTMVNRGAISIDMTTKAQVATIAEGYHNGSGSVQISATEQAKIIADNIKSGVTILGQNGNVTPAKEEETKTITPNFSSGNVVVSPTSGKVMTQVTVNKDTTNHIAENIKKDVTLYGITGNSFIAIELTQAQYDALTTKDSNTYYLING